MKRRGIASLATVFSKPSATSAVQVEKVAAMRRKIPLGGKNSRRLRCSRTLPSTVKLSELFGPGKNTLVVYSCYVYGPAMKFPCPMCTSFIDGLERERARQFTQRANLAVVAKSPFARIQEFAHSRGWNNLRLLSSANNNYNRDYFGEMPERGQMLSLNGLCGSAADKKIHHFLYQTELLFMPLPDKGQNERHLDMAWTLWNLLDFTPDGRGTEWFPQIQYAPSVVAPTAASPITAANESHSPGTARLPVSWISHVQIAFYVNPPNTAVARLKAIENPVRPHFPRASLRRGTVSAALLYRAEQE